LRAGSVSVAPGNRLVGRILAVVDAEELERVKARTQAAHKDLFEEGRPSGPAPYGYRSVKDEKGRPAFAEHPEEAEVVRDVFDWALAGHALQAIADKLNGAGIPPRSARFKFKDGRAVTGWKPNSVRYVLTSPSVAGLRSHRDADRRLHFTPARWPALVDVDRWKAVQRALGQPGMVLGSNGDAYRVRSQPKAQPRRYLLSGGRRRSGVVGRPGEGEVYGVLHCGRCGMPLVAQTQGRRDRTRIPAYACHTKLGPDSCGGVSISPADQVDELVVTAIQRRLATSPGLRKRLDAAADAEAARWRVERDQAKGRMLDASMLYGSRAIDRDSFEAMHGPAKRDFETAERHLAAMTSDATLPSVEDVQEGWDELTLKQQRSVVERLVRRIVIAPSVGGYTGFDADRVGEPEWLG
jgi:hypothetical protein